MMDRRDALRMIGTAAVRQRASRLCGPGRPLPSARPTLDLRLESARRGPSRRPSWAPAAGAASTPGTPTRLPNELRIGRRRRTESRAATNRWRPRTASRPSGVGTRGNARSTSRSSRMRSSSRRLITSTTARPMRAGARLRPAARKGYRTDVGAVQRHSRPGAVPRPAIVGVCHVLRYSPYFRMMKHVVDSGRIGDVASVQHLEPVEHIHMSHSFVRGNWRNSKESTPMLVSKSCHDLDILRWIIGLPCRRVQSFGSLRLFRREMAPAGGARPAALTAVLSRPRARSRRSTSTFAARPGSATRTPRHQRRVRSGSGSAGPITGDASSGSTTTWSTTRLSTCCSAIR